MSRFDELDLPAPTTTILTSKGITPDTVEWFALPHFLLALRLLDDAPIRRYSVTRKAVFSVLIIFSQPIA